MLGYLRARGGGDSPPGTGYGMCCPNAPMNTDAERRVRLFRNGRNQALRIPRAFEL